MAEKFRRNPTVRLRLGKPTLAAGEEGVHRSWAELIRRLWCHPDKRWRLTWASWASLVSSPQPFLYFYSQQQANLIPGLNLSALGIFSTGLSVLPPPAGPRGAPPAPPYHPFAVSSSAFRGLLMLLQAAASLCYAESELKLSFPAVLISDCRMNPAGPRTSS